MNDKKMLTSVLHTVQMGQSGIRCVMDKAISTDLKKEMKQQLDVYDSMEKEALNLGTRKGLQLTNIHPAILRMSEAMAKMRLMSGQRDSKIAGMLIQGNTRGMILGMKHLRQGKRADQAVQALTQRLVEQEKRSIHNSEKYL